ncbi:zinc-ribbon domain-containing protein, partial [Enterocloster asparagiformis]
MERRKRIMKYCKKCGAQMKDNAKFCPSCGA